MSDLGRGSGNDGAQSDAAQGRPRVHDTCFSGGCERKATAVITFLDGWKGHFCKFCASKIGSSTVRPLTTRERALMERNVPQVEA